ncbi:sugar O-acetyltransferase [Cellulomonas sp. NPDC089187]|uniref:sugar O-acetyltransferase n=1 Tax=Cellulomonas sp. NPDC089187 TaxID=3154970 RepID=UPI003418BBB9
MPVTPDPSMTEQQRMVAGYTYLSLDPELVAARARAQRLCREFNAVEPEDFTERTRILGELFGNVGDGCWIEPPLRCDYGSNITVGEGTFINLDLVALDTAPITIGSKVAIGPRVTLSAASHPIDPVQRMDELLECALPITIGDYVWIGANVVICPGVTIGPRTVIGAGSVVTQDIPADVVAGGVPCRVIRDITPADRDRYLDRNGPSSGRDFSLPE